MKDLHLPLPEDSSEVDYTTIENIKFSKKISGKERALHIANVFAEYYVAKVLKGSEREAYTEYGVKISNYNVGFRGYKNIVVCIIGDWSLPGFGPRARSSYGNKGRLFEEDKNVFPFRKVLEKLREMMKNDSDTLKNMELIAKEREFAVMELEGMAILEFGLDANKIFRVDQRYNPNPALDFQFSSHDSWYKSRFEKNVSDSSLYDIKIGSSIVMTRITIEEARSVIKPIVDLYKTIEERRMFHS